jgi:hypothetical protein
MADIHLHTPGAETVVQPEERVVELLRSGELGAPTLFWRSGMADWEPVANFPAGPAVPETQRLPATQPLSVIAAKSEQIAEEAAKAQRKPDSTSRPMPEVKSRPEPAEAVSRHVPATGRRRFNFRRDPEPLTTILQVMLVICICIAGLELANAVVRYSSMSTGLTSGLDAIGNPLPDASGQSPDQISSVSSDGSALLTPEPDSGGGDIGQLLQWTGWGANALLMVIYFMWLFRTDQNCRNFSSIMRFNPEWAVWCYFVPPLNTFRPLQVMQEIWRVSRNPRTWNNDRLSWLVASWWLLTLGTIGLAVYDFFYPFGAQGRAAETNAEFLFLLLKVMQVVWYGVFLTMITLIVHSQLRLVRESRRHGRDEEDEDE